MGVICIAAILSSLVCWCACINIKWIDGFVSEHSQNYTTEYTFYTDKQNWNEAKYVCEEEGGHLAKIDSRGLLDTILEIADETYNTDIFEKDYWVGLTEVSEGQFQWSSDCSGLTWTSNYVDNWKTDEKCYKLNKDQHYGKREHCDHDTAFLCERLINQPCLMETTSPVYEASVVTSQTEEVCRALCLADASCLATLFTSDNNECMKVVRSTNTTNGILNFSVKNCVKVTRIQTTVSPTHYNTLEPNLDCNTVSSTTTTSTTSRATTTHVPTTSATTTVCSCPSTSTTIASISTTSPVSTTACSCPVTTCPTHTTIAPATCPTTTIPYYVNYTNEEIMDIAREISKNLTVDAKSTSAHRRRVTSAEDNRPSSTAVGYTGLVFVVVPLFVLVISDVISILYFVKGNVRTLLSEWGTPNIPAVITVSSAEPDSVFGSHRYV